MVKHNMLKNTQMPIFMEIRPVGVESFCTEGQTDGHTAVTELTVAFRNFTNAPKILSARKSVGVCGVN